MVIALCHVLGRYELYGVVAHGGQLTSSGHYIAYIRADVTASVKSGNFLTTFTFIIYILVLGHYKLQNCFTAGNEIWHVPVHSVTPTDLNRVCLVLIRVLCQSLQKETRGQSNVTNGRLAMRRNRANVYREKTFTLSAVKFTQLMHH